MHDATRERAFWRAMFHRWFIQYNPTPLLSAAFVLGGAWQLSRAAATDGGLLGQLGVAAIAEVYSVALIGAAAFLHRLGLRRPAVMLGLLAALYLGDPTLHVETCVYLGAAGVFASVAWLALAMGKLALLAWALELRASRFVWTALAVGAAGLAGLPYLFRHAPADSAMAVSTVWLFGLAAAGLYGSLRVECLAGFDVRGRRALLGTWLLLGAMLVGHVVYWAHEHSTSALGLVPALALLGARLLRQERGVWGLTALSVVGTACVAPEHAATVAALAAVTLLIRAVKTPCDVEETSAAPRPPYRARSSEAEPAPKPIVDYGLAPAPARSRLVSGALGFGWIGLWAQGVSSGAAPSHWPAPTALALAVLLVGATVALARLRRGEPLLPLGLATAHLVVSHGWVGAPRGALEWGLASTATGFLLLATTVVGAWMAKRLQSGVELMAEPRVPEP